MVPRVRRKQQKKKRVKIMFTLSWVSVGVLLPVL